MPSPMVHSVAVKRLGGIIFDEAVPAVNLDAFVGARMKCGFLPFSNPDWLAAINHIRNSCDLPLIVVRGVQQPLAVISS